MTCSIEGCDGRVIDAADLDLVLDGRGRWRADPCDGKLYVARNEGPRPEREYVFLHRFLLGLQKGDGRLCDHVNGDGLDNRRSNIRLATGTQNCANRGPNAKNPGFKGVDARPNGRFRASIGIAGGTRYLGTFAEAEAAARAYDDAARAAYGEFARTNFPDAEVAA